LDSLAPPKSVSREQSPTLEGLSQPNAAISPMSLKNLMTAAFPLPIPNDTPSQNSKGLSNLMQAFPPGMDGPLGPENSFGQMPFPFSATPHHMGAAFLPEDPQFLTDPQMLAGGFYPMFGNSYGLSVGTGSDNAISKPGGPGKPDEPSQNPFNLLSSGFPETGSGAGADAFYGLPVFPGMFGGYPSYMNSFVHPMAPPHVFGWEMPPQYQAPVYSGQPAYNHVPGFDYDPGQYWMNPATMNAGSSNPPSNLPAWSLALEDRTPNPQPQSAHSIEQTARVPADIIPSQSPHFPDNAN